MPALWTRVAAWLMFVIFFLRRDMYAVNPERLPAFVTLATATKALNIGRSVLLLRSHAQPGEGASKSRAWQLYSSVASFLVSAPASGVCVYLPVNCSFLYSGVASFCCLSSSFRRAFLSSSNLFSHFLISRACVCVASLRLLCSLVCL